LLFFSFLGLFAGRNFPFSELFESHAHDYNNKEDKDKLYFFLGKKDTFVIFYLNIPDFLGFIKSKIN